MLLWSDRLPHSPVCAIFAFPFCTLELVLTLSGGLVVHPPVLYGPQQSRLRCCQDDIAPVGYADTGLGSQEHADCLAVAKKPKYVAHLLSAECTVLRPYLATTLHHLLAMLFPNKDLLSPVLHAVNSDTETVTSFFPDPSTDPTVIWFCMTIPKHSLLSGEPRDCSLDIHTYI